MTSFTYSGDITKAAQWLPFAKSRQMWMAKIGAMTQSYNPVSGVMITVQTVPMHIHIVVTGGNYHFMSRPSLSEAVYNSFIGTAPTGRDEVTHVVTGLSSSQIPTVLAYESPEADRHVWYGANRETVVSGYGTKYMTNRFPHNATDRRSPAAQQLYTGTVELFENGKSSYVAPFTAFNGFKIGNWLVGLDADGGYKYTTIGSGVYVEGDAGVTINSVDSSAFIPVITNNELGGAVLGTVWDYELRYESHSMNPGFNTCYAHWSINKLGTAAAGICMVTYSCAYLAYYTTGEAEGARNIHKDSTVSIHIPYLIELSIASNELGVTITPTVTPLPQYPNGLFVHGADYYYPASGLAIENELLLWGMEGFDHEFADIENPGQDISLIIKSASTEYVRDLFNYNSENVTGNSGSGAKITGKLYNIDVSALAYSIYESGTYMQRLRIHYNGYAVVKTKLLAGQYLDASNDGDYTDNTLTTSSPNMMWDMGFFVALRSPLIINPVDHALFYYLDNPLFASDYPATAWRADLYAKYNVDTDSFDKYYEYHALSSKAANVELEGTRHCVAAALIL